MKKKSCMTQNNVSGAQSNICFDACEYSLLNPTKKKIGILGGTFNPVHLGHLKMGLDAHDEFSLSKVIYIPTAKPPHKDNYDIISDIHRVAMLDLALTVPYMHVSDVELNRTGTTYTIDTLNELKKIYANEELYYIIGSDTLFTLNSWKRFYDVLSITNFIVFKRDNDDINKIHACIDFYNSLSKKQICLASKPGLEISSTVVRKCVKEKADVSNMLPEKVIEYIKENEIYI